MPRCLTATTRLHDTGSGVQSRWQVDCVLAANDEVFLCRPQSAHGVGSRQWQGERAMSPGRPLDRSVANPHWLPNDDPHNGINGGRRRGRSRLCATGDFLGHDPARLLPSGYSDRSLDVAAKNATWRFLRSSFDKPPQVCVGDPRGTKRRIDNFNDEITSQWKLGNVESVTIKGADDRDVQVWIIFPPDFDPKKKWPLVQMVHGATAQRRLPRTLATAGTRSFWAAQGWVVGIVNFHARPGSARSSPIRSPATWAPKHSKTS